MTDSDSTSESSSDSTRRGEGWSSWLDAGREALKAELALGRAGVSLTRAVLKGDMDAAQAGRTYAEALQREGNRYWTAASKLSATYAHDLAQLGAQVAERLMDDVQARRAGSGGQEASGGSSAPPPRPGTRRSTAERPTSEQPATGEEVVRFSETARPRRRPSPEDETTAADEPVRAVELRGALGTRTTDSFVVTNRRNRPRRTDIIAGPLLDGRSVPVPGIRLEVEPSQVTLRPREEAIVVVAIDLNRDMLVDGGIYHAEITVTGGEDATIEVTVTVE